MRSQMRRQKTESRRQKNGLLLLLSLSFYLLPFPLNPSLFFFLPATAQTNQIRKVEADQLLQQGIDQIESRQPEAALRMLEQALQIYQTIKDRHGEGKALANLGRAYFAFQSYAKAIDYSEQSLAIARSIKDQELELAVLKRLGLIYSITGNHPKAISAVEQILAIHRKNNNQVEEVRSLGDLGFVYLRAGNFDKAIEVQEQAVQLAQQLKDFSLTFEAQGNLEQTNIVLRGDALRRQMGEAPIATALEVEQTPTWRRAEADRLLQQGTQQLQNNQYYEAAESLEKSLKLYWQIRDQTGEARSLIGLGQAILKRGDSPKALELIQQAVAIAREVGNPEIQNAARQVLVVAQSSVNTEQNQEEAERLDTLAQTQVFRGELEAAYQSLQQALAIYRALNDRRKEMETLDMFATTLGNVSAVNRGEHNAVVIQYYEQALVIARELQDRKTEENIIDAINWTQRFSQENSEKFTRERIEETEQKLATARKSQDQNSEMTELISLGGDYFKIKDYVKAIIYYEQTIALAHKMQTSSKPEQIWSGRRGEGLALDGLGEIYAAQGNYAKAIEYHQKHLEVLDKYSPEDRNSLGETSPFSGIGYVLQQQNQPELAILFYKQAVNIIESNRQQSRKSRLEMEQSEYKPSDFMRAFSRWGDESRLLWNASTYRRLADLLLQQNRIIEAMQILDLLKVEDLQDFLKDVRGNALTQIGAELLPQEVAILQTLQASPRQSLQTVLQSSEIQAQVQSLRQTATDQNLKLKSYQDLQTQIKKLGQNIALFYPLILDDRLELVILANDRPPVRKSVSITSKQLETEIQTFRQQLQGRSPQIQQSAQQLYQRLIQPIEDELKAAEVDTIVYAPDSIMRYVPLTALHDGTQWLAQRYKVNYLTALALTPLDPDQNTTSRVLAAALTKNSQVKILGKTYNFPALQFTQPEVENLAKLLPNTTTLINQSFNRSNLNQGAAQSTILHLATHGMFVPGSPDQSIILLGDGSTLSLREIEQQWKFPNLSLVVLSACETAIGGKLGNGIEVLGFGYQMQRTGARATLSSLWTVDDGGTQILMNAFYSALNQGMTKAQAMQEAQKALITGDYSTVGGKRSDLEIVDAHTGQPVLLESNTLQHPYYWAPFILIGNSL